MLQEAIANSIEDDGCDEKEKRITGNAVENYEQNVWSVWAKRWFQMGLKNHELFVESVIDEPGSRAL